MTPEQIRIVKENFNQIAPLAEEVATEFYQRLFQLDASLKPLFKEDLSEQKKKLMMMFKFAVGTLDRIDVFEPSLEELGRKHVAYGVRDEHYETVGTALILTLQTMLGAALTEQLKTAWIAAYTLIAGIIFVEKDTIQNLCLHNLSPSFC
jgi:hemoglobin-like flavoprotein